MGNIVFSCIGHNFHLITGPLLIKPKRKKDVLSENADNEDIHQDDIEDLYEDCFDDLHVDHQIMIYIREMVEEIRKLSSFIIKNSSKTIEIIQKLQLNMNNKVLRVKNDVLTRWNSTLLMINRMIELHDPINEFLSFYKSASGRKDFKANKTKLPEITDEK